MKTYEQIMTDLASLESVFGFNPALVEQTSQEWQLLRLGVISASRAECLIAKKRGSKGTEYGTDYTVATASDSKRQSYLLKLVADVATAEISDDVFAKPLQWGRDNEAEARQAYEAATFCNTKEVPFIYKDQYMRAGISPDGLIEADKGGIELKCPWDSKTFVEFATQDVMKHEYRHQCQFSMWVTEREYWDFASFDPRMVNTAKLHYTRVERCPFAMEIFDEAYESFVSDMDDLLVRLGIEFGQQWDPAYHNFQSEA